jgi:hypothetical protein
MTVLDEKRVWMEKSVQMKVGERPKRPRDCARRGRL